MGARRARPRHTCQSMRVAPTKARTEASGVGRVRGAECMFSCGGRHRQVRRDSDIPYTPAKAFPKHGRKPMAWVCAALLDVCSRHGQGGRDRTMHTCRANLRAEWVCAALLDAWSRAGAPWPGWARPRHRHIPASAAIARSQILGESGCMVRCWTYVPVWARSGETATWIQSVHARESMPSGCAPRRWWRMHTAEKPRLPAEPRPVSCLGIPKGLHSNGARARRIQHQHIMP
jgi:hypothetical protein